MNDQTLELIAYQPTVYLDFGEIIFGRSEDLTLTIKNESDASVYVKKFPNQGFRKFHNDTPLSNEFEVKGNEEFKMKIVCCPVKLGDFLEFMTLKSGYLQFSIKMCGKTIEPKKKKPLAKNCQEEDKENIPPSQLNVSTPNVLVANTFKNITSEVLYGGDWLDAQQAVFVKVLNKIFCNKKITTDDEFITNLPDYQQKFKSLYDSAEIQTVISKMTEEINKGVLKMKSELLFRTNTRCNVDLMKLLCNYSSKWLRLGLEILFNETIDFKVDLKSVISSKLTWNSSLAKKYKIRTSSLFRHPRFETYLEQHIITKYFVLVFLLDCAKNSSILSADQNLFRKTAQFKSSLDLVKEFARKFLDNETNIEKRLKGWNCTLTCYQSYLADYDFTITKLTDTISDGIRLAQLAKLLTDIDVTSELFYPAIDLSRKLHNVTLAMSAFEKSGTPLLTYTGEKIDAESIKNGHKEKTLALIWCIISIHHVKVLINKTKLVGELQKLHKLSGNDSDNEISRYEKMKSMAVLEHWAIEVSSFYNVTNVGSFDSLLSNGRALCLLVHHYLPTCLPIEQIFQDEEDANLKNFKLLFAKLKQLGGAPINFDNVDIPPPKKLIISMLAFFSSRLIDLTPIIEALVRIQRFWRVHSNRIKRTRHFEAHIEDVKMLQAHIKRYLVQKKFNCTKSRIIKCQAIIKGWLVRRRIKKIVQSAIIIQATVKMIQQRKRYREMKRATIYFQSLYRRNRVLRKINEYKQAAVLIQSMFRAFLARVCYKKLQAAVVILQKNIRCYIVKQRYKSIKKATVVLQAHVRGFLVRQKVKSDLRSIIKIQTNIKRFLAVRRYQKIRNAAIVIQRNVRGISVRKRFLQKKASVLYIQSFIRMIFWRRQFLLVKSAAIQIQSWYKCRTTRMKYVKMREACMIIQKNIKCFITRTQFLLIKHSVIMIQKHVRGYRCKRQFLEKRSSAIVLQKNVRKMIDYKRYKIMVNGFTKLQANVKGGICRNNYLKLIESVVIVQKNVRCKQTMKKYTSMKRSCLMIQKNYRKFLWQNRYKKIRSSIIIIQKYIRMYIKKKELCMIKKSTILIQKNVRCYLYRKRFQHLKSMAVIIQKNFRQFSATKKYRSVKNSIVLIQSWMRCCLARKKYQVMINGFIKLQANCKRFVYRKKFQEAKNAAIIIQKSVRMFIARQWYEKQRRHCIVIQKNVKMFLYRKQFRSIRNFAVILQKHLRRYIVQKRFNILKRQVIILQSYVRRYIARINWKKQKDAVLLIQNNYRRYRTRKSLKILKAVVIIQSFFRRYICRKNYNSIRNKIVYLQSCVRVYLVRKQFLQLKMAAVCIQKNVRKQQALKRYQTVRRLSIGLVCLIKGNLTRKRFEEEKSEMIETRQLLLAELKAEAMALVSVRWRVIFYICVLSKKASIAKARIESIRTIQRVWRGSCIRSNLSMTDIGLDLSKIRARFLIAQTNFQECNTMRSIGDKALQELNNYSDMNVRNLCHSLRALEKVTKLSPEMCRWSAEQNVFSILEALIKDCNRGEADLEVVGLAISVLINLGRANVLELTSTNDEAANFLVDLMVRNVNSAKGARGVTVFCRTGLLLVLLIRCERGRHFLNALPSLISESLTLNEKLLNLITNMHRSLAVKWKNSNNHRFSERIVQEMRLSPYWDLSRNKSKPHFLDLKDTAMLNAETLKPQKFQKTFKIPLPLSGSNHANKNKSRRSSLCSSTNNISKLPKENVKSVSSSTGVRSSTIFSRSISILSENDVSIKGDKRNNGSSQEGQSKSMSNSITQLCGTLVTWDITHKYYIIKMLLFELGLLS